jgi:probable phosphoglycerate mutase
MRLILIRHGDAYAGFDEVVSGPKGCRGLTDLGRRQATALASHLTGTGRVRADVLLSSTLPRAVETARLIAPALGFEGFGQRSDLCEILTGEADGLMWNDYATRYGSFNMEAEPERAFAPGGESWVSFHERVRRLFDELVIEFAGQTVVAVCHAGVIVASIRVLLAVPHPGTGARLQPTNTGLTEWEHEATRQRWTLHSFNEQAHLLGLGNRSFALGSDGDDIGEGMSEIRAQRA